MQLIPNLQAIGVGLYHKPSQTLVFSDLHLGYEAELHAKGVLVPRRQFKETIAVVLEVIRRAGQVKTVVLNGDLKHSFGRISSQEWNDVLRLIDELRQHCETIVIIKGNHDVILQPVLSKKGVIAVGEFRIGDVLIVHGDKNLFAKKLKGVSTILIGHDHPAITLRQKSTVHKYKCYLVGKHKGNTIIVQPSTFPLLSGSDVTKEKLMSPLLPKDLGKFDVFVVDEKTQDVLRFGKLKNIV